MLVTAGLNPKDTHKIISPPAPNSQVYINLIGPKKSIIKSIFIKKVQGKIRRSKPTEVDSPAKKRCFLGL